MTGFFMKYNTGLKWDKVCAITNLSLQVSFMPFNVVVYQCL